MSSLPFWDAHTVGNSVKNLSPNSLYRNILNPISHHDAKKDMQYAIAEWLRMESSSDKRFLLIKLLENPTVDFKIQDNLRAWYNYQVGINATNRFVDSRRLSKLKPVIDQAVELGDMRPVLKLISKGLKITHLTLLAAAESGNLDLLKYLIDVSGIEPDIQTLIAATVSNASQMGNGRIQMVKYLVEVKKVQPNPLVLNMAARVASLGIIKYLLTRVDSSTNLVIFVLKPAALAGRIDIVKYILKTPGLVKNEPLFQATGNIDLLEEACESGSLELVKYLLHTYRVVPSIGCLNGATKSGNLKLVRLLIERYSLEPNQQTFECSLNSDAFNPYLVHYFINDFFMDPTIAFLYKAGEKGDLDFGKYLMDEFNIIPDLELLHRACYAGQEKFAIYLIEEMNLEPDDYCLTDAAWSGNLSLVEYLVSYGLQPTSLTLNVACKGADADLKHDHSSVIVYIGQILKI